MRHRSPARWLAPLALVLCLVAVAAVIGGNLGPDERSTSASGGAASDAAGTRTISDGDSEGRRTKRTRYTVRRGDTLSGISIKTGVPLAQLRRLNPKLDSDTLQTGQRIKLSP